MQKLKIVRNFILMCSLVLSSGLAKAQSTDALGTYTPYSLFGLGDIAKQGTAYNRALGGIGTGVRTNSQINFLNPASITERDTLSFMLDFGMHVKSYYSTDSKHKSAHNTANMQDFVFSAPIYRKSALMIGIAPYSSIGYKFQEKETDPYLVSKYGDIVYQKYGQGSINQLFIAAAMNISRHFAVGAQFIYYFGALDKFSNVNFSTDPTMRSVSTGWDYNLKGYSGIVGLQYFGNIAENTRLTVGATYKLATNLHGDYRRYAEATSSAGQIDTVLNKVYSGYRVKLPHEFSAGVSIAKKDKWMVGVDYSRQMWKDPMFEESLEFGAQPCAASSVKAGFEIVPNMYDIRYYMKRVTYRVGAYYDKSYVNLGGSQVNAFGLTLGMSFPIFRWHNAINWALDLGQRGSLQKVNINGDPVQMVRERYWKILININLHDLWFIKKRYQ